MSYLVIGLILFFGAHLFSVFRSRTSDGDIRVKWGYAKYMGIFSLVSLIGFGLIIWGYIHSPDQQELYSGLHELRHISWVFMLPALILVIAAYVPMGHIKRTLEHPMMIGVLIWAVFHLTTGGDLKRVLLFGAFAVYSLLSLAVSFKRGTILKEKPANIMGDIIAIMLGLVLTGVLMHGGHQALIGASPV